MLFILFCIYLYNKVMFVKAIILFVLRKCGWAGAGESEDATMVRRVNRS